MKMKNIAAVLWPAAWLLLWLRAAALQAPLPPMPAALHPLRLRPAKPPSYRDFRQRFHRPARTNPDDLDPALNSSIDGANTIITTFEPLLLIDENNDVVPGQAELPEVSEDGLTWTFTMKDGLKWSDGSDLTAKDFEYSFKRLACPDTAAPTARPLSA